MRRVLFMLAATLGRTVRELETTIGSDELAEWIALLAVEPWGPYRLDILHGMGAYASSAAWGGGSMNDWVIKWGAPPAKEIKLEGDALIDYLKSLGAK